MSQQNDIAITVAFLAGLKRVVEDIASDSTTPRSGGEILLRAAGQAAGTYVIAEILDDIDQPVARTAVAGGLAFAGHAVAEGDKATDLQQLLGDTLRCAAGSIAFLGAVEAASIAIRNLLTDRPFDEQPRVFVSHSWAESDEFFALKTRLHGEIAYLDHSVHVGKGFSELSDAELEKKLTHHIRGTHILLVLAHPRALASRWVQNEVEIAGRLGKPIIAVRPHGHRSRPLHPLLRQASIGQVGWNAPAVARRVRTWTDIARMAKDDE